jgi:hypothetical protein
MWGTTYQRAQSLQLRHVVASSAGWTAVIHSVRNCSTVRFDGLTIRPRPASLIASRHAFQASCSVSKSPFVIRG